MATVKETTGEQVAEAAVEAGPSSPVSPATTTYVAAHTPAELHRGGRTDEELQTKRRGKNWAAVSSILFALLLTGTKLVIGLATGSLGILSEALHSGMDLVGTGFSFVAIRISNRPADSTHPYGHAKFESLSALLCVGILTITSLGILNEAYRRITQSERAPEVTFWSFAVIILSISVDYTRSRYLKRAAEKYGSQALAADAAHFATDLYSSVSVLLGLTIVATGTYLRWPQQILTTIDALAGSVVAVIIFTVAFRLAVLAVNSLTDRVPPSLIESVEVAVDKAPGVVGAGVARVHYVGDQAYVDVSVGVPRGLSAEGTADVCQGVVTKVQELIPYADVVVNTRPVATESENAVDTACVAAARLGMVVHHVLAFDTPAGFRMDMHMEVPEQMSLGEAHEQADLLEAELRKEIPILQEVQVHIEPRRAELHILTACTDEGIAGRVAAAAASEEANGAAAGVHDIQVLKSEHGYVISVHCYLPAGTSIVAAHSMTADLERVIREQVPGIYRVTVHSEPAGSAAE